MYETHLTVIGTLITQVNRHRLVDGTTVVNFRVASNERRFDRSTESWTDGDSLYVSVSCWRQLAENVHRTFAVGDPIIVRGRLRSRTYEGRDGRPQSVTELEGLAVGPDLSRSVAAITKLRRDGAPLGLAPREGQNGTDEDGTGENGTHQDGIDGNGDSLAGDDSAMAGDRVSDDPWRIGDENTAGGPADGRERGDNRASVVEAAVGA